MHEKKKNEAVKIILLFLYKKTYLQKVRQSVSDLSFLWKWFTNVMKDLKLAKNRITDKWRHTERITVATGHTAYYDTIQTTTHVKQNTQMKFAWVVGWSQWNNSV